MSNATRQLIKIEKENENIKLRKRLRSSAKDKPSNNKKETVWERLSKVKKIPSAENSVAINKSRNNLTTKTFRRCQTIRQIAGNQPQQLLQEPQLQIVNCGALLSKNASSHNRCSNATQKLRLPKSIRGYSCKPNKSVNEILTPRSLSNSMSSLHDLKCTKRQSGASISPHYMPSIYGKVGARESINQNMIESSEDSNDEYKLAPLMSSCFKYDPNSSCLIKNKFRQVFKYKNKSMASIDIELVKDVVKSDHSNRNLDENNPKLFKDVLTTQLHDILIHEFAVKRALNRLASSASLQSNQELPCIKPKELSQIVGCTQNAKEPHKFEVDVIFKNVPSLEKEIIILRALGEKLEATLRSTRSHRDARTKSLESVAGPSILSKSVDKVLLMVEHKREIYILAVQHYAQVEVRVFGIAHVVGIVKEFCIAQKTIVELQQDANRPFYLPINPKSAELKRTSFKKLKENPKILLCHIKAKNAMVSFNVLEQDPVFFNNILFNNFETSSQQSLAVSTTEEHFIEKLLPEIPSLCEGGDSSIWKQIEKVHEFPLKDDSVPFKLIQSNIRGKQRRRVRGSLTPMPSNKITNPKNTLFKTILIGFLQMYLFILLIMAFTYPDPKC